MLSSGDLSHLASIFILLHKIQTSRSARGACLAQLSPVQSLALLTTIDARASFLAPVPQKTGISFKTQLLYVIVFLCRYVDLVTSPHVSVYNTVMKLFFIGSSIYTLYLIKVKFRSVTRFHSKSPLPLSGT